MIDRVEGTVVVGDDVRIGHHVRLLARKLEHCATQPRRAVAHVPTALDHLVRGRHEILDHRGVRRVVVHENNPLLVRTLEPVDQLTQRSQQVPDDDEDGSVPHCVRPRRTTLQSRRGTRVIFIAMDRSVA